MRTGLPRRVTAGKRSDLAGSECIYARPKCYAAALFLALAVDFSAAPATAGQNEPDDQPAEASQQSGYAASAPDYNGLDYTRPQQNAETRLEFRTSSSPTSQTDQEQLFLKLATKIDLSPEWKLGLLGQFELKDAETTTFAPPNTTREAGVGNSVAQAALIQTIDAHWAYGFGARLVAPTAQDSLGLDRWQIMPGFGVRYTFLEINSDTYFVPVVRWAVSFGGDPTQRNVNEPQIAPTLNVGLPDRWFFTLYPSNDIRINFGTPVSGQTGRLFLPFDAAVGRNITDRITAYLEVSVPLIKDYPVYDFKAELRISVKF